MWSHYKKNGRRTAEGTYKNNIKEGCFEKGQKILINGLAYPTDRKHGDGMFYVVPTNKFQAVPDNIEINQLTIAGRAFINDGKNPKVANLGIYCPVRKQDYINVSPPNQFSLPFLTP